MGLERLGGVGEGDPGFWRSVRRWVPLGVGGGLVSRWWISRAMCRFRQRMISRRVLPSVWRFWTYAMVSSPCPSDGRPPRSRPHRVKPPTRYGPCPPRASQVAGPSMISFRSAPNHVLSQKS